MGVRAIPPVDIPQRVLCRMSGHVHVCCVTTSPNCNSGGADWTFPHGLFDKNFSQSSRDVRGEVQVDGDTLLPVPVAFKEVTKRLSVTLYTRRHASAVGPGGESKPPEL